jgi:hypothetical protein
VFNHGDDDHMLAKRVKYVRIGKGVDRKNTGGAEVLGMDCEMICESPVSLSLQSGLRIDTTAGSSLARVTIVDESGTAVLDEVVRQHVPVLYVSLLSVTPRSCGIDDQGRECSILRYQSGPIRCGCNGHQRSSRSKLDVHWTRDDTRWSRVSPVE